MFSDQLQKSTSWYLRRSDALHGRPYNTSVSVSSVTNKLAAISQWLSARLVKQSGASLILGSVGKTALVGGATDDFV